MQGGGSQLRSGTEVVLVDYTKGMHRADRRIAISESESECEEYERGCRRCGVDISNAPNYNICYDCWKNDRVGRSGRVLRESARQSPERQLLRRRLEAPRLEALLCRRLRRDRCPECPKSGGSEACPKCSPLNFCFLTEHGNSSDDAMSKDMCPKCTPHNFCRDTGHGNSEESPAHKSACKKCSPEYFGCMEDPKAFRNPGNTKPG